ncbi:hypothetical protein SteCoe_3868 [Stentor coeruleus]|uniref:Uncharacterized protein n=1 Tax=Stentor coeruleus TaxID=5963 RepID=A0A1R2CVY9_9CILI|nr:hypothetical protein SteCoe_3868 [Stentor coeruleus]
MVRKILRKAKLWTLKEDSILKATIKKIGIKNWRSVSQDVSKKIKIARTAKQCRDRWLNYLTKGIKISAFSEIEIKKLYKMQKIYGNRWLKMAKRLPGRTENQVKNFFYAMIRRNIRKFNKGKEESEKLKFISMDMLKNNEVRKLLLSKKGLSSAKLRQTKLSKEALSFLKSLRNDQKGTNEEITKNILSNRDIFKDLDQSEGKVEILENFDQVNSDNIKDKPSFLFPSCILPIPLGLSEYLKYEMPEVKNGEISDRLIMKSL